VFTSTSWCSLTPPVTRVTHHSIKGSREFVLSPLHASPQNSPRPPPNPQCLGARINRPAQLSLGPGAGPPLKRPSGYCWARGRPHCGGSSNLTGWSRSKCAGLRRSTVTYSSRPAMSPGCETARYRGVETFPGGSFGERTHTPLT